MSNRRVQEESSLRPFPRLKFIGAGLAAAALLLSFKAPAQAGDTVYVSNLSKTTAFPSFAVDSNIRA